MSWSWIPRHLDDIWDLTLSHLWLTLLPTLIGLVIAVPLGTLAAYLPKVKQIIVGGFGMLYTIPSLALFVLLPGIIGTKILDPVNIVVALTIYTVALLVRVIADGLLSVPPVTLQAATGMGLGLRQRFFKVQLPLALPPLISGLRVVVVSNVSIVTVAATIGISQLGSLFTMGFTRRSFIPIVAGLGACLILALVLDLLIATIGRRLTPWVRAAG
ncbi:MAG: ABC transporter permease subunit [Bifidobacteriaceae bacterium]|jgi:osmoprotectant transport system permease protein|nr:ABC transporter permease subunit [Bifidobacteriaceae bacterium]